MSAAAALRPPGSGRSASLGEAWRRCETTECAGLRVEQPSVRAIAAAWVEEAANVGGGLVWRPAQGGLWLLGGTATTCRRAMELLHGMGWAAELLAFPRDLPALAAAMAAEPKTPLAASAPNAAGLEEHAARLAPELGHALATLWRMGASGPTLLAQRWTIDPAALPAPPSIDWAGHGAGLLAARLLALAGHGRWPANRKPNLPLLLDMPWMPPPAALPAPPPGSGHALVLPLACLGEAPAWTAASAAAGWRLAWTGLAPSLAHLLHHLPGGFVFATPGDAEGFPPSERLILSGIADRAVMARALAGGLGICSVLE